MKKVVICLLCVLLLCGCCYTPDIKENKPTIVATIYPLYDFARAVGGDNINIKILIKPGLEVHSYDPLPSDMMAIYDSDLFLYMGGESDKWVNTLCDAPNVNGLALINAVSDHEQHVHHNHNHSDEHIWTSPDNAILMLKKIKDKIIEIDGKNAAVYNKNYEAYIKKIADASEETEKTVLKSDNPFILVADRFPFEYFTEKYGIEYEAAFDSCAISTDISLKTMTRLTKTIENRNIKAVFCTELSSKNIANALSQQHGVDVIELHSAHNVTVDDFNNGITYVDIMYRNVKALKRGLGE